MGMFSFIKEAGAKIFGLDKNKADESRQVSEDKAEERRRMNARAANKLETTIHDLGLKVENLNITIEDDMAIVAGKALDQATREKIVLVVGNSEGISKVDDSMDVEREEPEAIFHTVETGDTLSKIAKEHYGNAGKYPVIFEANKPMLKDPDKIYPGQVLRIPELKK